MKPEKIGRIAGTGLRIAGRIAEKQLTGPAQPAAGNGQGRPESTDPKAAGRAAGQMTRGVARGVGGFLRPFGRVGGILWLEVTGVFFLLFVPVFAPIAWRTRPPGLSGPYDRTFIASTAVVAVFLYLSITSFLRARKK